MASINPFEYINAISFSKENVLEREDGERDYCPFLTNRGLSQHQDSVLLAQYMNLYHQNLPYALQFTFLRLTIPKRKRFGKWAKKSVEEDILLIKEYFDYSYQKASEIADLISEENLKRIKTSLNKGGVDKGNNHE